MVLIQAGGQQGLTTFSTFGFETVRLLEDGSLAKATVNALGSVTAGVLAAAGGYALVHAAI